MTNLVEEKTRFENFGNLFGDNLADIEDSRIILGNFIIDVNAKIKQMINEETNNDKTVGTLLYTNIEIFKERTGVERNNHFFNFLQACGFVVDVQENNPIKLKRTKFTENNNPVRNTADRVVAIHQVEIMRTDFENFQVNTFKGDEIRKFLRTVNVKINALPLLRVQAGFLNHVFEGEAERFKRFLNTYQFTADADGFITFSPIEEEGEGWEITVKKLKVRALNEVFDKYTKISLENLENEEVVKRMLQDINKAIGTLDMSTGYSTNKTEAQFFNTVFKFEYAESDFYKILVICQFVTMATLTDIKFEQKTYSSNDDMWTPWAQVVVMVQNAKPVVHTLQKFFGTDNLKKPPAFNLKRISELSQEVNAAIKNLRTVDYYLSDKIFKFDVVFEKGGTHSAAFDFLTQCLLTVQLAIDVNDNNVVQNVVRFVQVHSQTTLDILAKRFFVDKTYINMRDKEKIRMENTARLKANGSLWELWRNSMPQPPSLERTPTVEDPTWVAFPEKVTKLDVGGTGGYYSYTDSVRRVFALRAKVETEEEVDKNDTLLEYVFDKTENHFFKNDRERSFGKKNLVNSHLHPDVLTKIFGSMD